MEPARIPDDEAARLRALQLHHILDTSSEQSFDDLTRLAATLCDVPICLISLVDEGRQWFKSKWGLSAAETSRDIAFCSHAILEDELFVVADAKADPRFADNPLVTGEPEIRFYAGAQLKVASGHSLGTLCVIDHKPRDLTEEQTTALRVLRQAVVTQLELRRALKDLHLTERFLAMCSWCRAVRLGDGAWVKADEYLEHAASVTHALCPDCEGSASTD